MIVWKHSGDLGPDEGLNGSIRIGDVITAALGGDGQIAGMFECLKRKG